MVLPTWQQVLWGREGCNRRVVATLERQQFRKGGMFSDSLPAPRGRVQCSVLSQFSKNLKKPSEWVIDSRLDGPLVCHAYLLRLSGGKAQHLLFTGRVPAHYQWEERGRCLPRGWITRHLAMYGKAAIPPAVILAAKWVMAVLYTT